MLNNSSIGCTVTECKHNNGTENCCTLQRIQVTKNRSNVDCPECTDCASFVKK